MKQIFVLSDLPMATNKALSALAVGEICAYGYDANGTFGPVVEDTTSPTIYFGIGNGTASPFLTNGINAKVKQARFVKSTYAAEVLPSVAVIATTTSYAYSPYDEINITLESEELFNQNLKKKEVFTVLPTANTATSIHGLIAAEITAKSENFTAVHNGATNVTISAKATGIVRCSIEFVRYSGAAATTNPTFAINPTLATEGVGTKAKVEELVDRLYQNFGIGETIDRYGKTSIKQAVPGTSYTMLRFTYKEDKVTSATVDTHYTDNELIFACDITDGTPSTLVADLEDFINYTFLEVPIPVV